MTASLHVRRSGEGPPAVLLHGLFGSGSNLGALARSLEGYSVYAVDLPGHGRSGWLPQYDLPLMAEVVAHWMEAAGLAAAQFVGHSLGGKVAMELALRQPQRVRSLVVADIAPVSYAPSHAAVFAALRAVAAADCRSRADAARHMRQHLREESVIQFLLTSLYRDEDGGYRWRLDVTGLERDYAQLLAAPRGGASWAGPVLFIKGERSDYIGDGQREAINTLFPAATVTAMADCGHWLHAEKPEQFNGIVSRFFAAHVGNADSAR